MNADELTPEEIKDWQMWATEMRFPDSKITWTSQDDDTVEQSVPFRIGYQIARLAHALSWIIARLLIVCAVLAPWLVIGGVVWWVITK